MRVADFIARRLRFLGVTDVFMVTGGAAMHLNDAFALAFPSRVHCLHHEQSCAIAAESYARVSGVPAVVNVTAGPGGINAINGVFGAFVDSIPMIIVSGQAKRETLTINAGVPGLRQLGDQEVDIVHMVSAVCKRAVIVQDPLSIAEELDRAFSEATSGRPGPVWLDIPIDVQATPLPEGFELRLTSPLPDCDKLSLSGDPVASDEEIFAIASRILRSRRPVLYVGSGVRISNSYREFLQFLEQWPIATVTGWNSNDLLWDEHPCYCGRPGTVGNRAGNFAVQYSDCVLTVGCRLNIRQVSFNWKSFAKYAWTCHVDIDRAELDKPILSTDLKVQATIKGFFPRLSAALTDLTTDNQHPSDSMPRWGLWRHWLQQQLTRFSPVKSALPDRQEGINPYRLIHQLTALLDPGSTIVCADGTACVVGFQAAVVKPNQRLYHNSGCASMGYELPAAIGAFHAKSLPIICIAGDGSIMMNLQELSIIGGLHYPIGIYLLNNRGYHSIRQTQNNYFPGNPIGCGVESGLPFPRFDALCQGFGLTYFRSDSETELQRNLALSLEVQGPYLHEIILDLGQDFTPKLISKKLDDGTMVTSELEDMAPFLGESEMTRIKAEAMAI
jgi:acetolactate synthase-1/2/3 large subunit